MKLRLCHAKETVTSPTHFPDVIKSFSTKEIHPCPTIIRLFLTVTCIWKKTTAWHTKHVKIKTALFFKEKVKEVKDFLKFLDVTSHRHVPSFSLIIPKCISTHTNSRRAMLTQAVKSPCHRYLSISSLTLSTCLHRKSFFVPILSHHKQQHLICCIQAVASCGTLKTMFHNSSPSMDVRTN